MRAAFSSAALLAAVLMAAALHDVEAMDKVRGARGIFVDVKGMSGKFTIGRRNPPDKDPQKISVVMDAMRELDADGNEVGKSGKRKHSFNNFAKSGFTIGELEDTTVAVTGGTVPAKRLVFSSDLFDNTSVNVTTYIILGRGNITIGDEETPVRNGTVKFTIAINNWAFCKASTTDKNDPTYCKNDAKDGAMVDFDLTIKGKNPKPEKLPETARMRALRQIEEAVAGGRVLAGKKKKPKRFKMSSAADMDFSTKVRVDGTWQDMATGYPMLDTKGSKSTFTFRFPKGAALFYDPAVTFTSETEDNGEGGDGGGSDNAAGVASPSLAGAAAALLAAGAAALANRA